MDYSLALLPKPHKLHFLPSKVVTQQFLPSVTVRTFSKWKSLVVRAGHNRCEPSPGSNRSFFTPPETKSSVGEFLRSVSKNQPQLFELAVGAELKLLADDRDAALERMLISRESDEAQLHRRIADMKEQECQTAAEEAMYLMIFHEFSEIGVHLIPRISNCIYKGRLELTPSNHWHLEHIHDDDSLEMTRKHVNFLVGLRPDSSISEAWTTTLIRKEQLSQFYSASILYGYLLKSGSSSYVLEDSLTMMSQELLFGGHGNIRFSKTKACRWKNFASGPISSGKGFSIPYEDKSYSVECELDHLRSYVMRYYVEGLQRNTRLKSKEAEYLMQHHIHSLFCDESMNDMIMTSFSSLKTLVLEAIAFGCFLREAEEYVNSVYKLKE